MSSRRSDQLAKNPLRKRVHDATGPGSASRIPLLKRAVILALNWHAGLSFDAIAVKVHVNARTAGRIVNRAKV